MTSMNQLFFNCASLQTLDVSNFNTSNVTIMSSMFRNCPSLQTLDISNFDMSNVTNMNYMFRNSTSLTTVIMNNTSQTTFDMIKNQLVSDNLTAAVTIIRDGVSWVYQNGSWVAQ